MTPAWIPCDCGNYWCTIHETHVHECPCLPIEDWDRDPYAEGGEIKPTTDWQDARTKAKATFSTYMDSIVRIP